MAFEAKRFGLSQWRIAEVLVGGLFVRAAWRYALRKNVACSIFAMSFSRAR
jgi:hypothetical protein